MTDLLFHCLPEKRRYYLILSTAGSLSVEGVKGRDEDLLKFSPTSLGVHTTGRWELFFDGSTVALTASSEDVNALWLDPGQGTFIFPRTSESIVVVPPLPGGWYRWFNDSTPRHNGKIKIFNDRSVIFNGSARVL